MFARNKGVRPDLILHTVKKETLQITIQERGSIESAENNEMSCQVKAKTPNAPATSIRWVIDNGSIVKKGDKLMDLDDSVLQDQLTTQQIATEKARGDWLQAEEEYKVQVSTAQGAVQTAKTNLEVATITLAEYLQGLYAQTNIDLDNKVTMARSDLSMWEERAAWSERMSRPGRQFVTSAQAEADQARLLSARLTLKNMETQFDVLNRLTKEKNRVDLQGKIDEFERAVERAKLAAKATEVKFDVARKTFQMNYDKEAVRLHDIEKEIEKCYIKAPRARHGGLLRRGTRPLVGDTHDDRPGRVGERGTEADEHPESEPDGRQRSRPRGHGFARESRCHGRYRLQRGREYRAAPDAESARRRDHVRRLRDGPANALQHRSSPAREKTGLRGMDATVRVNAFSGSLLKGHVKSVATVASQADLFGSDVKVYQTFVSIDESMEGLRPGMDAQITIHVDSQPEPVLAIPLQAVLGTVEMGQKRKCFVITPHGHDLREVTLGMTNEKLVEVKDGLEEGDVIVLNPVVLLTEKEAHGVRHPSGPGPARTRRTEGAGRRQRERQRQRRA